jgi:hypothetical protein
MTWPDGKRVVIIRMLSDSIFNLDLNQNRRTGNLVDHIGLFSHNVAYTRNDVQSIVSEYLD